MYNELVFLGENDYSDNYIGGGAHLIDNSMWPMDNEEKPMLHLLSISAKFLHLYQEKITISDELVISVFTPFSVSNEEYIEQALNAGGKIVVHKKSSNIINLYENGPEPKKIDVIINPDEDDADNGIAKIGGIPTYLQDKLDTSEYIYTLQINNSRLNKAFPSHKGILAGGIGTLLLKNLITLDTPEPGIFSIQTT